MTYYDEELKTAQWQMNRRNQLRIIIEDLLIQEKELNGKIGDLYRDMKKEQSDVDNLTSLNLTSIFADITGTKEEKLKKEKREAYLAALKYDMARNELNQILEDKMDYQQQLNDLKGCDKVYEKLLKQKLHDIKQSGSPAVNKIAKIEGVIGYIESQKKEVDEALAVGKDCRSLADRVYRSLKTANDAAAVDLITKSLIVEFAKHSKLDEAQRLVHQLQLKLREFKTELADVTIHLDTQIKIDSFTKFADIFFDNIFTDLSVKNHIRENIRQVDSIKSQIKAVLKELTNMRKTCDVKISECEAKLHNAIIDAQI